MSDLYKKFLYHKTQACLHIELIKQHTESMKEHLNKAKEIWGIK